MSRKPNGYWKDPQRIRAVAAQCSSRSEFSKKHPAAYRQATELNLLDDLFGANTVTPDGVNKHSYSDWTNDELTRALSGFRTRSDAEKVLGDRPLKEARTRGILDEILPRRKAVNYTLETALAKARGLKSLTDFQRSEAGAYGFLLDNGHLPALHRVLPPKPHECWDREIKWTDEKLRKLSTDLGGNLASLRQKYPGAYKKLLANPQLSQELFPDRKRQSYWNVETATAEAATCSDQAELRTRSYTAYAILRDAGKLDELLPPREKKKWTEKALIDLFGTGNFKTRSDFFRAHPGACQAARQLGLLDKWLPAIVPAKMTLQEAIEIAKACGSRSELLKRSSTAYLLVQGARLFDKYYPLETIEWTDENIRKYASQFNSRSDFMAEYPGGYKAANFRGHDYMDEVFSHMVDRTPSDRDAIYVWKSVGEYFNRKQVYKFGVTSIRLKGRRIRQVARAAGVKAEVVVVRKVRMNADLVEGFLLALGDDPQFVGRDGATEFRTLSDSELKKALDIIEHYKEGSQETLHNVVIDGTAPTSGRRGRDNTIRKWVHYSGEVFMGSRHDIAQKLDVSPSAPGSVIQGVHIHVKGWGLDEAPDKSKIGFAGENNPRMDKTNYLWINEDGRKEICTRYGMKIKHEMPSAEASRLINGKKDSWRGWRVVRVDS